ncbi:hypothetical protein [Bosea sp. (in: a-proteobacteria)]|uniref:hypothetical protein n=1 Tax=Bosea sp. (in: a-proteobacteria) TaxID=1871050 RepID=UPI0011FE1579|nr:hypothetical protein [Bosea sp. (in: a-proteobacteria)]TAJ26889.1 MAG: hypothetical protein EPO59_23705 [Bosea sp. (in: a-proteobacteria)]
MLSRIMIAAGLGLAAAASALPAAAQGKKPGSQVTITNQRAVPLLALEITSAGEQPLLVAKLAKPLPPGKSVVLKLTRARGCAYTVQGRFDDEADTDAEIDLCKERVLRLTE